MKYFLGAMLLICSNVQLAQAEYCGNGFCPFNYPYSYSGGYNQYPPSQFFNSPFYPSGYYGRGTPAPLYLPGSLCPSGGCGCGLPGCTCAPGQCLCGPGYNCGCGGCGAGFNANQGFGPFVPQPIAPFAHGGDGSAPSVGEHPLAQPGPMGLYWFPVGAQTAKLSAHGQTVRVPPGAIQSALHNYEFYFLLRDGRVQFPDGSIRSPGQPYSASLAGPMIGMQLLPSGQETPAPAAQTPVERQPASQKAELETRTVHSKAELESLLDEIRSRNDRRYVVFELTQTGCVPCATLLASLKQSLTPAAKQKALIVKINRDAELESNEQPLQNAYRALTKEGQITSEIVPDITVLRFNADTRDFDKVSDGEQGPLVYGNGRSPHQDPAAFGSYLGSFLSNRASP